MEKVKQLQNKCNHKWIEDDVRGGNAVLECLKCGKTKIGLLSKEYKRKNQNTN